MSSRHPFRTALLVVFSVILLGALYFASPFLWFAFETHRWEGQIRRHQNPEELRSWAINLISVYSASNYSDMIPGEVTNKPPLGIPLSGRFPKVGVAHDGGYGPYSVALFWGEGFLPLWGMEIGETNFVCKDEKAVMWKPGIYFLEH